MNITASDCRLAVPIFVLALIVFARPAISQPDDAEDVGANRSQWRGNEICFYDVWEGVTRQEYTCNEGGLAAAERKTERCRERFWNKYDPTGQKRGLNYTVARCKRKGYEESYCEERVQKLRDGRQQDFLEKCFADDGPCRREWDQCGRIVDNCRRQYVEWNYYDERCFEVPCRPFAAMKWDDKAWPQRNNWVSLWDHIERIDNRGFVGDPSALKNFLSIEGRPMHVRYTEKAVDDLGHVPKVGSYYFVDHKYGRLSFSAKKPGEERFRAKITLPFDYKYAGGKYERFSWTKYLYLCEDTFTEAEVERIFRKWGLGEDAASF